MGTSYGGNTYGAIVKLTNEGVLENISDNLEQPIRVRKVFVDSEGYLYAIIAIVDNNSYINNLYRSVKSTTTAYKLSQIPEVNVYPNPAKDKINLITNSQNIDLSDAILQFYNINGENFKNIKGFSDNIDISGFPKGLIFCKLSKNNLGLSKFKFIKL